MELAVLLVCAVITYSLYGVFASQASNRIDATLASVVFNGLAFVIPFVIYVFYKFVRHDRLIPTTQTGLFYSLLAGIAIALFSILLVKLFEKGDVAYVMPVVYGGTIVVSSLVGWVYLKETVSLLQGVGIVVTLAGVLLVVLSRLSIH